MDKKLGNQDIAILPILIAILLIMGISHFISIGTLFPKSATASSIWKQTTDTDFYNGTLENTTVFNTDSEANLRLKLKEFNDWSEKTPPTGPSARGAVGITPVWGTNKVLLYGGYTVDANDETWLYDYTNNTWEEKTPLINPGRRNSHVLTPILGTDNILLNGGSDGAHVREETWIYDYSENTWKEKQGSGPNRGGHGGASIFGTDKIVIFGGADSGNAIALTEVYDVSEDKWTYKFPPIEPMKRHSFGMASVYNEDKVVIFGGRNGSESFNDTWIYDLSMNRWTQKFPINSPSIRYKHSMATILYTDKVLLFGPDNQTWIYDVSDNTWTRKFPQKEPFERYYLETTSIWGNGKILLFGGYNNQKEAQDDTWIYTPTISSTDGTFTSIQYDTGSSSIFKFLKWQGDTPANTNLKFQLRTSKKKIGLSSKEFIGPNGLPNEFYKEKSSNIWSGHNGDRWIQYKAYLNIDKPTESPILDQVKIIYNCLSKTNLTSPSNCSYISINEPTLSWSFSDFDSTIQAGFQVLIDDNMNFNSIDFDSGKQTSTNQFWQFYSGNSKNPGLPDGIWYWKVCTCDEDGDWGDFSNTWSFVLDSNQPISTITTPNDQEFYNDLKLISGEASDGESGSGIKKVEISIKRLSDHQYWSGSTWVKYDTWLIAKGANDWSYDSSKIPWTSGMEYKIRSRATDNFNNLENLKKGKTITFDSENPTTTIDFPEDNANLKFLYKITGSANDIGKSGIKSVQIYIKQLNDNSYWSGKDWVIDEEWLDVNGSTTWIYDTSKVKWTTDMQYIIKSRSIDYANNQELISPESTFIFDNQPPGELLITINNDDIYTNTIKSTITLSAHDRGSGISKMAFSFDSISWQLWEDFNTTKKLVLEPYEGERTVYFKVKDYADNIAEPVFDTIVLDTTQPSELDIEINNNSKYTTSTDVLLDLSANDTLSGLSDMSFSFDKQNWTTWEEYKEQKSLKLSTGDGKKEVYFKVRDKAGNLAKKVSDSIKLDSTPPRSLSIQINTGEKEIDTTKVYLYLSAIDDVSGISQMSISLDGTNWSEWEEFNYVKSFNLPEGDGEKTVYFKVKDNAGNVADEVSTTVILKTKSEKGSQTFAENINILVGFLIIMIVIILSLMIFLVLKKRKKKDTAQTPIRTEPSPTPFQTPKQQMTHRQIPTPKPQTLQETPKMESKAVDGEVCMACGHQLYMINKETRLYCYHCKKYE